MSSGANIPSEQLQISQMDRDSNLGGKILTQNSVILSENFFSSIITSSRDATGAAQAFVQISGLAPSGAEPLLVIFLHKFGML